MKPIVLALLLLFTLGAALDAPPQPAPPSGPVGRFQLVAARVRPAGEEERGHVFKIDTATGQVWEFVSGVAGGRAHQGFLPVPTHDSRPQK